MSEKLLTVEEVEASRRYDHCYGAAPCYSCWAEATIIALAERLARVERCSKCFGGVGTDKPRRSVVWDAKQRRWVDCPDCEDHPGLEYKDWQAALRAVGGDACELCESDDDGCYCRYEAEPDTGEE